MKDHLLKDNKKNKSLHIIGLVSAKHIIVLIYQDVVNIIKVNFL